MTKILIVCGAILSIFLSALVIAYASNASSIRDSVASYQAEAQAAQSQLRETNAKVGSDKAAYDTARQALADERDAAVKEMKAATLEKSKLVAERNEARLAYDQQQGQMATLSAGATLSAETIKALNEEVANLRKAQLESAKRETDLVDRLNDVESQRQVLEQSTRALQEQLASAKSALDRAAAGGSGTLGAKDNTPRPVLSGPVIQARVKSVRQTPAGATLVVISEGTGAGLRTNQLMYVVRDGKFIGNLVVTAVDASEAAGTVDTLGRPVSAMANDLVLSRLN